MSDSDSDDGEREVNWDLLALTLAPETLAAMKEHFEAKKSQQVAKPTVIVGNTAGAALPNTVFSKREYWEGRFEEEESYEWLVKFDDVKHLITPRLKNSDRILIVGCGNSSFSKDLYDAGFENIVNIDYSLVLIEKMRAQHATDSPRMEWVHMDMTKLSFEGGAFDVVIDKAAMDSLMVDEGDVWYPNGGVVTAVDDMCVGIRRVLKSQGVFLMISFAQPHFRTKYLMGHHKTGAAVSPYETHTGLSEEYQWTVTSQSIDLEVGCLNSFFYVATKVN